MGKRTLGDILLSQGRVTQAQIDDAIELQHTAPDRLRIGRILVQEVSSTRTPWPPPWPRPMTARAGPFPVTVPLEVARLLPREVAMRHVTVPIRADVDSVIIAVADPVDVVALTTCGPGCPGVSSRSWWRREFQIADLLDRAWGEQRHREALSQLVDRESPEPELGATSDSGASAIVNQLLTTAAVRRASDLHVEPQARSVRVRLRVDGIMRDLMELPKESLPSVVARIKIISGLMSFGVPQMVGPRCASVGRSATSGCRHCPPSMVRRSCCACFLRLRNCPG